LGGLRFATITAGGGITCALTTGGKAYCWGFNTNGALGNGDSTVVTADVPTPVVGGLTLRSISAEALHACALTLGGEAYCWGDNYNGALGTSGVPRYNSYGPIKVTGSTVFGAISAGYQQNTCALDTGGSGYCWGHNGFLGTGDTVTVVYAPKVVQGGLKSSALHTNNVKQCGVAAGAAYCWGDGRYGELGSRTKRCGAGVQSHTSWVIPQAPFGPHPSRSRLECRLWSSVPVDITRAA
jgi:hypothetical protein